ncbi:MAG: AsmA family protein [Flavobacteriales bacterium]
MKKVKKILKVTLVVIVVLIGIAAVLPFLFNGQIKQKIIDEANKNLKAKVEFGAVDLSFLSTFPDFGLKIEDIKVTGKKPFKGIKLADVKKIETSLDVMSVISGDNIEIKTFGLYDTDVHIKVLEDGTANWNIMKASGDTAAKKPQETANKGKGSPLKGSLQHYEIKNLNFIYDDASLETYVNVKDLDHEGTGDFTTSNFTLDTKTSIKSVDFKFADVKYANKASVDLDAKFGMNMEKMKFTFKKNKLLLNDLALGFDGYFKMPEKGYEMDITYKTKKTSFKTLLSMVPAIYKKNFEKVKTSGELELDGHVAGTYTEENMPGFGLNLKVTGARFQYPDMPASVENIGVDFHVERSEGKSLDNTLIDLNKFHMEMAGNPFDMQMNLKTPISDPDIFCKLKTELDLASISKVVPLEEEEKYMGKISADMEIDGKMSAVEEQRFEDFKAVGNLMIKDMLYSSELPYDVMINTLDFQFSPEYLELAKLIRL